MTKMREKPWWLWLLMIVCLGIVKAHIHMIRLIILLALGLGGLYMLHLLAGDFQKLTNTFRPGAEMLLGSVTRLSRGRRAAEISQLQTNWVADRIIKDTKELREVIKNDPIGCARKYVCHISHKSRAKLTRSQDNVLLLLRTFSWLDINGEWKKAEELGKKKGGEGACEKEYNKCWYSGVQLDKFMSIF